MRTALRSRDELLRLVEDEARLRAAYGRMMGAFERCETPAVADFDEFFSFASPEQKADFRLAAMACIQLLASEGNPEASGLAREYGITFRPLQIQ